MDLDSLVLESDLTYAKSCLEGYQFFKNRDLFWSKMYWDTLQDLIKRKNDHVSPKKLITISIEIG